MRLAPLLLAAAATLLSAPCLTAQVTLESTSGKTMTGTIVSDDGTSVEIEADGKKVKVPYDALTLVSQYRVQKAKTAEDGKSQLALAEWCLGKTLYEQARTHYRKALAADVQMTDEINAKVVAARTTAATELLARAKSLQAAGDSKEARRILSLLVQELPLEEASTEARQLLADDTTQRKQTTLTSARKPAARSSAPAGKDPPLRDNGQPFSEDAVRLFQPIIDSYQKLLDATQDGLVKGGSAGIKEFEKALAEADKIRKTVDSLKAKGEGNEEITEALARVDSKLEEAVVDVRVNLVDSYLMRSSYNQASDVVKQGLVAYPKNEALRQAMNRVTAAAADGIGGDWVIVGGGGGRR